jgi:hypothetical protein
LAAASLIRRLGQPARARRCYDLGGRRSVNHIKMVKPQMFGRAGLPLLRKRVLLTAEPSQRRQPYPSRNKGQIPELTRRATMDLRRRQYVARVQLDAHPHNDYGFHL